jgi:hypothetical protein
MKKNRALIKVLLLSLVGLFMITSSKAQTIPSGANAVFCQGASVSITAAADVNAVSYIWKRYNGKDLTDPSPLTLTGQNTATLTDTPPSTPGFYTYVSVAVNIGGCESAPSDPKTIYVLPGITAGITSTYTNNILCTTEANTGTLTANPGKVETVPETFAGTDYNYQWNKDGTPITGATNATYTLSTADVATIGTFNYTVTIVYKNRICNPATSAAAALKVVALAGKPVITIN